MSTYALDSNIISFYLKGNSIVIENIEKAIDGDHTIIITRIAYYEVKRGLLLINATKQLRKNDYILVTDNIKHFQDITDLHAVNWVIR